MLAVVRNECVEVTFKNISFGFNIGKWNKFKRKEGAEKLNSNSNTST